MSGNNNSNRPEVPEILVNDVPYFSFSRVGSVRTVRSTTSERSFDSSPEVLQTQRLPYRAAPALPALTPLASIDEEVFRNGVFGESGEDEQSEPDSRDAFLNDHARDASWYPDGYTTPEARNSDELVRDGNDVDEDEYYEESSDGFSFTTNNTEAQLQTAFTDFDSTTSAGSKEDAADMRVPFLTGAKPWVRRSSSTIARTYDQMSSRMNADADAEVAISARAIMDRTVLPSSKIRRLAESALKAGPSRVVKVAPAKKRVSLSTDTDYVPYLVSSASAFSFAPSEQEQVDIRARWMSRMEKRAVLHNQTIADRTAISSQSMEPTPSISDAGASGALARRNAQRKKAKVSKSPPRLPGRWRKK